MKLKMRGLRSITTVAASTVLSIGSCVNGFSVVAPLVTSAKTFSSSRRQTSRLWAEGGPPKYDKRMGRLRQAEAVAEGSVLLHIDDYDDGPELDYEPGHVLALEIEDIGGSDDGEWLRGPYTVTRGTDSSIDILLKVVGKKSKTFANAPPGTPVRFGGKFHVPIVEGILSAKSNSDDGPAPANPTKRVVMISSGVGVGPCIGAIEKLITDDDVSSFFDAKVELFASYRTKEEIVAENQLNELQAKYTERFSWTPIITDRMGRLSSKDENIGLVLRQGEEGDATCNISETHYHLIGNGQMVSEWKQGLQKGGVPENRITIESYFNHRSEPNMAAIERIASMVESGALAKPTV